MELLALRESSWKHAGYSKHKPYEPPYAHRNASEHGGPSGSQPASGYLRAFYTFTRVLYLLLVELTCIHSDAGIEGIEG